jgi:hypothetical protein
VTDYQSNEAKKAMYLANITKIVGTLALLIAAPLGQAQQSSASANPKEQLQQQKDAEWLNKIAEKAIQENEHFRQIAKAYREAAIKPTIPEDAHRCDVQALAAVNEKKLSGGGRFVETGSRECAVVAGRTF